MSRYDFSAPRLFLDAPLQVGARVQLEKQQSHYLCNVLRLAAGDAVLVFNGNDGEWRAVLTACGRKAIELNIEQQTRPPEPPNDLHYLFAPLKHARLDYMAQKAVEMGAGRLQPVLTRRTQTERLNLDRLQANAIEAAEQCGILALPTIGEPVRLDAYLERRADGRILVFCDEDAPPVSPLPLLREALRPKGVPCLPTDVLIGPEGGFAPEEREKLLGTPNHVRISLGPRILRADTAAVAVLALVEAIRSE
ncbi:16S rRNA (uracil(1498)-N(3))-methyltransferase [Beijerinckia mobilis]|uniref:16S rRNA (uracil(1498)-N(3))-methyltransferase n=1 Tax=Beijerinckia mobilis TaxID=231434 RepID=UPI0005553D51|nr:16S rRNA (uracil(1498)-N(3))-methyltransferase [Beijerinckia mobilis]